MDVQTPAIVKEQSEQARQLVAMAKLALANVAKTAMEAGRLFTEAKKIIGHGNWQKFLIDNGVAPRTARWAMKKYQDKIKTDLAVLDEFFSEREPGDEDEQNGNCRFNQTPATNRAARVGQSQAKSFEWKGRDSKPANVNHLGKSAPRTPATTAPRKAPAPSPQLLDAAGIPWPDHLRDIAADTSLAELIDRIDCVAGMVDPEGWTKRAGDLSKWYGFILLAKFPDTALEALHCLQNLVEWLRAGLVTHLCPRCKGVDSRSNGATCKACAGYGAIPEHRYAELINA